MNNVIDGSLNSNKKPFVQPVLVELDVRGTQTSDNPDPNEFNPFIGPTS